MKRHALWIAAGLLVAMAAAGCRDKQQVTPIPPLPPSRALNGPVGEKAETAEGPETEATDAADETRTDPARPRTPEELEKEVREAVARLKKQGLIKDTAELQADETPPVRPGEPPVKVSAAVPLKADEPIRRPPAGTDTSGVPRKSGVSLTTITVAKADTKSADSGGKTPGTLAPTGKLTLDNLAKRYERLAAANPADTEIARTSRLLHFLSGDDAAALEAIVGLSAHDQQVWHWTVSSMISARDRIPGMSEADQAAEVLEDLDRVRDVLAKQAPLELGEVRFCSAVRRFGDYDPLPVNRFRPGEQTTLYAEIQNYVSEQGDDGLYRVRLNVTLSLERPDGTSVSQESIPNVVDTCRRPRQDFFLRATFPIPGNVTPGKYVLKITFEDAAAHKQTGARLELEVGH